MSFPFFFSTLESEFIDAIKTAEAGCFVILWDGLPGYGFSAYAELQVSNYFKFKDIYFSGALSKASRSDAIDIGSPAEDLS